MSTLTKKQFAIEGMHCTSCAMTIDWELEDVAGVQEADTSYADARTVVTFDPQTTSLDDLLAAIKRAGFEGKPV